MIHHHIKCEAPYFERTESGQKTFEIRKNDRDYQVGDRVTMIKTERNQLAMTAFPIMVRPKLELTITYVTAYEQKHGYVVFGHEPFVEAETSGT